MNLFLSTPSARRATSIASAKPSAIAISIHALREEGDNLVRWCLHLQRNFYPRPPRGGRRRIGAAHVQHDPISIHALREEGDPAVHQAEGLLPRFLSTPSARRATYGFPIKLHIVYISIHALREEGDQLSVKECFR